VEVKVLHVFRLIKLCLIALILVSLASCGPSEDEGGEQRSRIRFEVIASVQEKSLNEISGIEAFSSENGLHTHFVVHNDDGDPDLWILDESGDMARKLEIKGAKNRDWEDLTLIHREGQTLLTVGDIGDNLGIRSSIRLYFIEWPPLQKSTSFEKHHKLKLTYPDGARDCEAMAYDPSTDRLLFMTKRDKPPRLYSLDVSQALKASEMELDFLGTVASLRPPTREDLRQFGKDGSWISQPTGMDISDDGSMAAVITYRSLYLFERKSNQTWEEVFTTRPREFLGPVSNSEEAIAFDVNNQAVIISSEDQPAPIFRAELPAPATDQK